MKDGLCGVKADKLLVGVLVVVIVRRILFHKISTAMVSSFFTPSPLQFKAKNPTVSMINNRAANFKRLEDYYFLQKQQLYTFFLLIYSAVVLNDVVMKI